MLRGGSEERPQAGQPANSAAPSAGTSSELSSAVGPQGREVEAPARETERNKGKSSKPCKARASKAKAYVMSDSDSDADSPLSRAKSKRNKESSKEAGRLVLRPLFVFIENYEFVVFVFPV